MNKRQKTLDLKSTERLVDRQRRLWGHAEVIKLAQKRGEPLPEEVSEWLHRALENIACGKDANEVLNVVPEKQGVRKDSFLRELKKKIVNGYIAAATETTTDGSKLKKTSQAIKEISQALPDTRQTTVRKNWNGVSIDRKPTFTIGKK